MIMSVPRVSHGRASPAITIGPFTLTEAVYAPRQRVGRHEHERPSWTLVLAGGFEEQFSRTAVVGRPGTVLAKPAAADHANVYGPDGAHCLLIETRDDEHAFGSPTLHDHGIVPRLARRIATELAAGHQPAAGFALEECLIELGAATGRPRADRVTGRAAWLNGVRDQIEAEFRAPPSLASLARARGVHPAHLCQAFRAAFGVSVGQFLRQVRFEWARDALRLGRGSLADIACAAGFSDQAHFSRDFRRRAGVTPREFRLGRASL